MIKLRKKVSWVAATRSEAKPPAEFKVARRPALGASGPPVRPAHREPNWHVGLFCGVSRPVDLRSPAGAFGECLMSILAWIVLGLIAGFVASKLVDRSGGSLVLDLLLGVVGAFVGGFLFTRFGAAGVTGLNLYSILVAIVGAVVVLFIYHAIAGRRTL
jgi:uncharacterized membrane protein YeaQ/YmgE (transglycosylase-associated protein family)